MFYILNFIKFTLLISGLFLMILYSNLSTPKSWISSDITIGYNQISEKKPIAIAFEYGTKFTPDTMLYFHPSFGIGSERQYNHGIEFGLVILY